MVEALKVSNGRARMGDFCQITIVDRKDGVCLQLDGQVSR